MNLALSSLEQGLIYSILAMGVYISFKILRIADMSVEGSFPLGALFTASLLLKDVNPLIVTILALFIGMIPGIIASGLTIKIKTTPLLSGILTMTMFYSINLRIAGKPNVPFSKSENIFNLIKTGNSYLDRIIVLIIIVAILKLILDWFFRTKIGYMLFTTGDNETLVKSLGESPEKYKVIGLAMANGLVALSGSLFAQSMKFADIQMGIGILVISLASIIIGDTIFRNKPIKGTTRAILGAILYKIIGALAIEAGLNPHDLKLVNSLIVIIFIAYNNNYMKIIKAITSGGKNA